MSIETYLLEIHVPALKTAYITTGYHIVFWLN